MAEPKAAKPRCDVPGCGSFADTCTDGTEKDAQGLDRPALKNLNVCVRHENWAHSDDAATWVANNKKLYESRS